MARHQDRHKRDSYEGLHFAYFNALCRRTGTAAGVMNEVRLHCFCSADRVSEGDISIAGRVSSLVLAHAETSLAPGCVISDLVHYRAALRISRRHRHTGISGCAPFLVSVASRAGPRFGVKIIPITFIVHDDGRAFAVLHWRISVSRNTTAQSIVIGGRPTPYRSHHCSSI